MTEVSRNYHGKYFLTLVFASILLAISCAAITPQIPKAEATAASSNYTFLHDTFDNDLSGWQYYGNPGYQLSLDSTTGVPSPSAHVEGDAWLGNCSKHGMYKIVDISSYAGGALTLGLNWRASSSSTFGTTEAAIEVDNADTGNPIFTYRLANSGAMDTGWQYYSNNISTYLSTEKRLKIDAYLYDCWSVNYDEKDWYDNISLIWNTAPSAPNAPTGLTATKASSSQINLSWNAPVNNGGSPITGYKIERSTDFGSTWNTIITNTNSTANTYSDTGLQSKYYTYRVSAINAVGVGPPSNTASANTSGGSTIEFSSDGSFSGVINATSTLIIDNGVTVSSNGITNYGYIRNMGAISMNSNGNMTIDNHGVILNTNSGGISSANINNYQSANMTNENTGYGFYFRTLNNYGNFTTLGGISSYGGHINNYATGTLTSYGSGELYQASLTNYGLVNSYGYVQLDWGAIYTNGTYNSHANIDLFPVQGGDGITNGVGGIFNNFAGAQISIPTRTGGYSYGFFNYGIVNNAGSFYNSDQIVNGGTFNNDGTINQSGADNHAMRIATITNSGTFNNKPDGTVNNGGIFDKTCGATYNNNGTFNGNPVFGACTTNQVVSITPTSGTTGTKVTVVGNNFQPNHTIDVMFYSNRIPTALSTSPSPVISNSTGGFNATFTIPSTTYTGHTVAPTDNTYSATSTFVVSASTPPSPPQNLVATMDSSQIDLSWAAPTSDGGSAITGYMIERSTDGGTTWGAIASNTGSTATTFSDTILASNTAYTYRVSAINSIGTSSPSNTVSITTQSIPPSRVFLNDSFNNISGWQYYGNPGYQLSLDSTTGVPSPSAHISGDAWLGNCSRHGMYKIVDISSNTGNTLQLGFNWRASSSSNYGTTKAEVSVNNADTGTQLFSYTLASSSATDTNWQHYSTYLSNISGVKKIQINLYLFDCWSTDYSENNWYDNVSLVGSNGSSSPPGAPTGLTASAGSSSQINLSWTAPTNNGGSAITNYKIYRSTSSGTETLLATIGNLTLYNDGTVTSGQTYFYKVTAVNAIGESSLSNESNATPTNSVTDPQPPTGLTATTISSSQINLSWTAPSNNGGSSITGYEVERSKGNLSFGGFSNSTSNTFFSAPNATTFSDTSLYASTTYNYTVFAKNSVGASSASNTASATTPTDTPQPGIILNNIQSTSGTTSSSNQITLANFNTGTGNNRLLVVGISANNNDVASITFGGVPLTNKAHSFYNNDAEFWYLKNPTSTGDIVVTMNGPASAVVGAYSFSGVNQTSPLPTSTSKHNVSPNSPNITITTKFANDWVLDLPSIYGGSTLGSPTCTQQWDANVPDAITGASSSKMIPTPGSVTCKWTASSGDLWDDVAVEIKASQ